MKPRAQRPRERSIVSFRRGRRLSVALVYPNTYAVGMSSLGFLTVYRLFNELDGITCERVFFDPRSPEARSLESGRLLVDFDVIAFSLSFEMDYLHAAQMIHAAGIPLLSAQRQRSHPVIMAGGVSVTLNPEVLAEIFDLFFIGESEDGLGTFVQHLLAHLEKRSSRQTLLNAMAIIPGVYVPRLYTVAYAGDGTVAAIEPLGNAPRKVQRQYRLNLDSAQSYSPILSPESHFKEMLLIEMGRGCPRGCRFCASGFIYKPVRFRSARSLLAQIGSLEGATKRIGLVGSAVSDHPQFEQVCAALVGEGYELGVSSFRADALTPSIMETLVRGGMKTLTIAPETGSEELRQRIHKNLTDEEILAAVRLAARSGIANLKLYFLLGLPFPDLDDAAGIVAFVKRIREAFVADKRRPGTITVSIHPFVPKAWTPFQWSQMRGEEHLASALKLIQKGLEGIRGLRIVPKNPRQALLQGVFSVGDRRVGEAIRFKVEGQRPWRSVWKQTDIDPAFYIFRQKEMEEMLPWEVVDTGIEKRVLWDDYQRAMA